MNLRKGIFFSTCLLVAASLNAQATVIVSSDFDGRTVNGTTTSNIDWVTNGVASPGDLNAMIVGNATNAVFEMFDTSAAQNKFAVNRNINDEGDWSVDIGLSVLAGSNIALDSLELDAFIFNNSGNLQGVERLLGMTVELFDSNMALLFGSSVNEIFSTGGGLSGTDADARAVSFGLGGTQLVQGTDYTVRITANGSLPVSGNNSGFDNLVINGDLLAPQVVSAPASILLILMGFAGMAARKVKR
jgi:hypothetical protein